MSEGSVAADDARDGLPVAPPAITQVVLVFAAAGVVSGFLFAIAPFALRAQAQSLTSFIAPVVLGLLVAATHALNWKRLRDPDHRHPRGRLLGFNLALLVFFLIGFVFLYRFGKSFPHQPPLMIAFLVLWPLPLMVNAIYLCAPRDVG